MKQLELLPAQATIRAFLAQMNGPLPPERVLIELNDMVRHWAFIFDDPRKGSPRTIAFTCPKLEPAPPI